MALAARRRLGKQAVQELIEQLGLRRNRTRPASGGLDGGEGRWGITPLAREIGMSAATLLAWINNGEVAPVEHLPSGRFVIHADAALIEQLRQRRQKPLSAVSLGTLARKFEGANMTSNQSQNRNSGIEDGTLNACLPGFTTFGG